eukprot:TRINITY_DN616_c0_g1_i1.p1 TRINITY_DN616_c0_g1~~TRINITY_DN616_c0_g1_i1.p1  ORF type:complete len:195 (-),score=43.18 TRINITY_DN616_c0_g1_i1:89-673(-)
MADNRNIYQLVLVGIGGVGKSCLCIQFISGKFVDDYDPTLEDSYRKQVTVDDEVCILDIFDTAGQEVFSAVRDQYMRSGDGFLIVYSITVQESFDQAIELHQHILQVKDTDEVSVVLVGNKCDMSDSREVPVEKGKDLAAELNCPFFETSAKTNVNVKEIFESLVKEINNRRKDNNNTAGDKKTDRKRRKCILL